MAQSTKGATRRRIRRTRMAQAAAVHAVLPRNLSFTATQTHPHYFDLALQRVAPLEYSRLETILLKAIASHLVGARSGRKAPP